MILGITGSIASGKSTVSSIFKDIGVPIYDADIISKEVSQRKDTVEEIKNIFGNKAIKCDKISKKIDTEYLRQVIFSDKEKLNALNNIIHPKVKKIFIDIRDKNHKEEPNKLIIFDIPLLFEAHVEDLCDKTLVVVISEVLQLERLCKRDNINIKMAKKIIDSQMPQAEKIKKADIVLYNDGSLDDLAAKIKKIYNDLTNK